MVSDWYVLALWGRPPYNVSRLLCCRWPLRGNSDIWELSGSMSLHISWFTTTKKLIKRETARIHSKEMLPFNQSKYFIRFDSSSKQIKFPLSNILISDQVSNQRKSVLSFFVQNLHIKHFKEKWSIAKGMELERWCNSSFKIGFTMVKIKIVIDQDDHDVLISSRCLCFFSDK